MIRSRNLSWWSAAGLSLLVCALFAPSLAVGISQDDDETEGRARESDRAEPARRDVDRPAARRNRNFPLRVPAGIQVVGDVVFATTTKDDGSPRDLTLDAFFPKVSGDDALPAIVYIHGGGFHSGSKEQGNQLCAILATGGYFTASIEYRLTGEAKFPAAIHDCKAAIRFLRANAAELGIDPDRIGVWGHSAGGHLAAFLGTSGNAKETDGDVGEFDDVSSRVTCVVDFFGPADLPALFSHRHREVRRIRGQLFGPEPEDFDAKLRSVSPVTWVDGDDPPILIVHGTEDRLVPIDQSQSFYETLIAAGVSSELIAVDGAGHGITDADVMIRVVEFFDSHLGGDSAETVEMIRAYAQSRNDRRLRRDDD